MTAFPIHKAKAHLSHLVARACAGETVIIAKGNKPVVRLVPIEGGSGRKFGAFHGRAKVTAAFFEPLPKGELKGWGK